MARPPGHSNITEDEERLTMLMVAGIPIAPLVTLGNSKNLVDPTSRVLAANAEKPRKRF